MSDSKLGYVDVEGLGRINLSDVLEIQCPCGLMVWVCDLPDHPGASAVIHKEPRCKEFQQMSPMDFLAYCRENK